MAVFSVYNYDTLGFDYYESSADKSHFQLGGVPYSYHKVGPSIGNSALGTTAENMAARLPIDAVKTGSGETPKGTIASKPTTGVPINMKSAAVFGGLIGLAWCLRNSLK